MGQKKKYEVRLSRKERNQLEKFVSSGKKSAREITRGRVLLLADEGKKDHETVQVLGITRQTVSSLRKKYAESGFEQVVDLLKENPRSGRPIKIDTRVEANITLMACSDPPEGSAKWTLRMMADHLVKLEVIESISHESVRVALKKTN